MTAHEHIDVTDGFKKSSLDESIENRILRHCERFGITPLEAVKQYCVLTRRQTFKRLLAHVDIFKMTLTVPGDIAELGVFRGVGLFTWANLLESYCIGDRTKMVFGFDNWMGFGRFSEEDGRENMHSGKVIGGFNPGTYFEELNNAIAIFDADRFIPAKPRIKLINGDIEDTIPAFVCENPGVRFSLVHFDCDLYSPTKTALECLWERVVRGGILIFDEYSIHDWPGETAAVDEFIKDRPDMKLEKFTWTNVPGAYVIKR